MQMQSQWKLPLTLDHWGVLRMGHPFRADLSRVREQPFTAPVNHPLRLLPRNGADWGRAVLSPPNPEGADS